MGGLIHTVASNKHRYEKNDRKFEDILVELYSMQMKKMVTALHKLMGPTFLWFVQPKVTIP